MSGEAPDIDPANLTAQQLIDGLREYTKDPRDKHSRRVKNPVTDRYETVEELSKNGYLRHYLELLHTIGSQSIVDLNESPVLTFDKDKYEVHETENHVVLQKREPDTRLDELVLEDGKNHG